MGHWLIDFVGPINPPGKSTGARYIITMTKYLTRWAEEREVKDCSANTIGILVVVIDVNLSHWFCTAKLMKVFGHEGQCT
jgi:hypothetical protein